MWDIFLEISQKKVSCVRGLIVTHVNVWFRRLSPERGCFEDVERADSLRGFTRQDKRRLQRNWSSTSTKHGMPRREFLQVRSYPTRLDRESDTSYSFNDHHDESDDGASGRYRRGKQQIERNSIMTFLDFKKTAIIMNLKCKTKIWRNKGLVSIAKSHFILIKKNTVL